MCLLKKKIVSFIVFVLGVILALTPFVIAPVCPAMPNGKYMVCHYSGLLAMYSGVAIAVLSIVSFFVKNKIVDIVFHIVNSIIALAVILIPNRIIKVQIDTMKDGMPRFMGFCGKDTMNCIVHNTFV